MATLGAVIGVGEGNFAPDQKLTREQTATMLARLTSAMGKPLTAQAASFADSAAISSWAAEAVGQMQATGIMSGVGDNKFAPADDYTCEQSILTMMRLFDLVE
jgi:S-layer homology domain.